MPQPPDREFDIENSTVEETNIAQGDQARTLQGNSNHAAVGDGNILVDGHDNTIVVTKTAAPQRPRLQRLLLQEVEKEIVGRLSRSLHRQVLIQLGKETAPHQVNRPWDAEIRIGQQTPEPVPADQTIFDVFNRPDIAEQLLILGHPGAGKTTTMLELAQALATQAQENSDAEIPVLVNLSSWQKGSISDWLVKEINSKYGVKQDLARQLIEERRLLPLLDGLDELPGQLQEPCVVEINRWLDSDQRVDRLVLCSRLKEFETYKTQPNINGAICLQPLTSGQIEDYFQRVGQLDTLEMVRQDPQMAELVQTPLWLGVLTLAHRQIDPDRWQHLTTSEARIAALLDAYIAARLQEKQAGKSRFYRPKQIPKPQQTRRWLTWLARHMDQDEFLIERMQPDLLKSRREKFQMCLIRGLITGLILGLILGLIWGLITWLILGLILGLITGLIMGLTAGLTAGLITRPSKGSILWLILDPSEIETVEVLQISFSHDARKTYLEKIIWGLIWGLILGLILWLNEGLILGLIAGLILGLIAGLIRGLIEGCKADIQTQIHPNQGILNSGRNNLVLLAVTIPASALLLWGLPPLVTQVLTLNEKALSLVTGAGIVMLFFSIWAYGGGGAYLHHYALRFVLSRSGKIPYLYANFLNYCTERLLLQRVGGRFRFIHRTLQEHFAAMDF